MRSSTNQAVSSAEFPWRRMLLSSRKTLEICIVCSLNKIKKAFSTVLRIQPEKVNEVKTMFRHSNMAVQNISVTQFFHPDSSVSSRDTCSRHVHCLMILSPATLARVLAEGCGRSSWVRGSAFQVTGKFAKRVTTSWLVNIFFLFRIAFTLKLLPGVGNIPPKWNLTKTARLMNVHCVCRVAEKSSDWWFPGDGSILTRPKKKWAVKFGYC